MSEGISVVIPVWNGERHLAEAIESALGQTVRPIEVVVVDDGSTDGSAAIAESLEATVVGTGHAGTGAALNRGVAATGGSILAFLDADDVWPPQRCEVLAALLDEDRSLDAAMGSIDEFISPELTAAERRALRTPNRGMQSPLATAMLIRRGAFRKVGPFDESLAIGTGLEWASRLADRGIKLGRITDIVLLRRLHSQNTGVRLRDERGAYARILKRRLDRIRRGDGGG